VLRAIVLGIVQGLTEFLPISSSAHLSIVPRLLGYATPTLSFEVLLHFGTLAAVVAYFARDLWAFLLCLVAPGRLGPREARTRRRLLGLLALASVPAAAVGFLLQDWADEQTLGQGITAHDGGTMVVIQGPRFSTRAESRWFQDNGWKVINMTGYPEAPLARELELCYVNVSLITDYDVGLEGMPGVAPVSHSEVVRVFEENNAKLKDLLFALLPSIPAERTCPCATALKGARFEV